LKNFLNSSKEVGKASGDFQKQNDTGPLKFPHIFRQIQIDGMIPNVSEIRHTEIIDSEHLLFYGYESRIYLMRYDLLNLNCVFLDKNDVGQIVSSFVFDHKNRHNFCIMCHGHNAVCTLAHFQIENSRLVRDQYFELDHTALVLSCERLDGNCLQAVVGDEDKYFGEYNLAIGNQSRTFTKLFDLEPAMDFDKCDVSVTKLFYNYNDLSSCNTFGVKILAIFLIAIPRTWISKFMFLICTHVKCVRSNTILSLLTHV
jgi:hypothetical protein